MPDTWKAIAARKQDERASRIPPAWRLQSQPTPIADSLLHVPRQCGLLNETEWALTENHDATSLLGLLASRQVTSETVTRAFCKRAAIAQQVANCLTEILFDDALARARELDAHLARTGRPLGPLHGLPISLKDTFKIRGYDASLGVANLCFKPAEANAALVDLLLSLGAVLYCKTNVPQTMMSLDSHNNIFGRTLNPANLRLTAGGSTGGEGALLALRGSVLGVGTDVGGSIRIPGACNGLYAIKPSHGRVPFAGQAGGTRPGLSKLSIEATAGPLATSLRDCELFLRVIGDNILQAHDPDVLPQTWAQQMTLSAPAATAAAASPPLRVGIIRTDGHVTPLPPVATLLDEVAAQLGSSTSQQRFEVIEVDASAILSRVLKTFNGIVSIDGSNSWFDHFDATSEPLSPWLQGRISRREKKTTDEIWDLQGQRTALQDQFLRVWHESGGYWDTKASRAKRGDRTLDAIICPMAPHPIAPIDRWNTANYTAAFNLLDLSAGILPVRKLRAEDLVGEVPKSPPLNGWDKINRELWTKVDKHVYIGSTLSVQVLTPRLTERKLLEVMGKIDETLSTSQQTPSTRSKL